ncbi:vitelline membrane outer layer protein 1-like isoform X2 [Macrobrachium rosenbergii]|uniref:vitelline membrane outer layer protein 1-like isoform X2 n=1 Tax=Macrobrachium rosenbergii TaxID=79674 RepID=UPI0034D43408
MYHLPSFGISPKLRKATFIFVLHGHSAQLLPNQQDDNMTSLLIAICVLFCGCAAAGVKDPNRLITKNLVISNGLDFGQWADIEYCYDGSYVNNIEVLFEPYSILHIDETAINAVKLYCVNNVGQHTGYIVSKIGEKGDWQGERECPNGLMTGVRAKVLPYQGSSADDVAVQNIEIECNYGESTVLAMDETLFSSDKTEVNPGVWSEWSVCDGDSAVCGLKVRYEAPFLIEDTTAISDISLYCCSVWTPPTVPPSD